MVNMISTMEQQGNVLIVLDKERDGAETGERWKSAGSTEVLRQMPQRRTRL